MVSATRIGSLLLIALLAVTGCDFDLDIANPNALTQEEVLTTPEGIISLAVGMQAEFAGAVEDYLVPPSLVTDEWGTKTAALSCYDVLFTGPPDLIVNDCGTVEAPWANSYQVVRMANDLLANAGTVGLDPNTVTGIETLAKLFKGMALGRISQQYEQMPIDVSVQDPQLVSREVVLDTAIALLEDARSDLAGVSAAQLGTFRSRVLGDGFDLRNTIDAMLARYYLFDGQFQNAIDAAGRVDQTVLSIFDYQSPDENPVYNLSFSLTYIGALASWAREAEAGDDRVTFWVDTTRVLEGKEEGVELMEFNQYATPTDPFPVYLPDEMTLIQAEAHTRLGNFPEARRLINEVRTQCSSGIEEPVACLDSLTEAAVDTEAELLSQIAYERAYELYMQGLRWPDTRRLDDFITVEPLIDFLPIPQQECLANTSAPC